jgi:hypothetical protein
VILCICISHCLWIFARFVRVVSVVIVDTSAVCVRRGSSCTFRVFDLSVWRPNWRASRSIARVYATSVSVSFVDGFMRVPKLSKTHTFPPPPHPPPQAPIAVITSSNFSLVAGFITAPEEFLMKMCLRN